VAAASAMLVLASLAWAGNHAMARAVNAARWLIVALLMALIAGRTLRKDWPLIRDYPLVLAFLGTLGCGIFGVLQFVGLRYTGALNMGVMNSVAPALIAIASFIIFRDRIFPLQALGIAISLMGVLAIVSKLDLQVLATFAFNPGDMIIFLNMTLWAVYSACLRLKPPIAGTSFLFILAVWGFATTLPGAVLEYWEGDFLRADAITLGTLAYSSVVSGTLAYVFWGRGIDVLGVNRAGAFLHLVPFFGVILATTLLGETFGAHHALGLALILSGVTLAVGVASRRAQASRRL
jgi:drug/metabolite transporter (DMT)-like permease